MASRRAGTATNFSRAERTCGCIQTSAVCGSHHSANEVTACPSGRCARRCFGLLATAGGHAFFRGTRSCRGFAKYAVDDTLVVAFVAFGERASIVGDDSNVFLF